MHIFKHTGFKRALITFPKVAGTTIQNLFTPNYELHNLGLGQHNNFVGWKTVRLTPDPQTFFDLRFAMQNIPEDYKVTILYKEPIDRSISGVSTMLKEESPGLVRYHETPDESIWADKKISWYHDYIERIFSISGLNYDFDNVHTMRIMLYIFILGAELPNVEFVEISELNDWVKDTHQLPDTFEILKANTEISMFFTKINKVLRKQFADDPGGIGNYIMPDMKMYNYLQQHSSVKPTFLRDLDLITDFFQEAYPAGTNPLTSVYPQSRWYMSTMIEWLEHGTQMPAIVRDQINTHIIEIVGRYVDVTVNGDLDVRVQVQSSKGS